jgi:hypothetical protein
MERLNDDFCEICDRRVAPLYRGICRACWLESVESGIHAWDDLPAELREEGR